MNLAQHPSGPDPAQPGPNSPDTAPRTLDLAAVGVPLRVLGVRCPNGRTQWERWLEEIGFIPGERVMLKPGRALGGDPLVVSIGDSTFALRRIEACCVQIGPA